MTDRRALFTGGAAAAAAAAVLVTPNTASARPLEDVLRAGELRVGVNPTLPPRALFNEKNEIDGFEPEVAAAIARKLGVRLTLQAVGSPERIPMVASGRIDFVMGAMSRTSERAKVIDYTVPVHSENYGIVAIQGRGHTSIAALNNPDVRRCGVLPPFPISNARSQMHAYSCWIITQTAIAPWRREGRKLPSMELIQYALRCAPSGKYSGR